MPLPESLYERRLFDVWIRPHRMECKKCGWFFHPGDWIPIQEDGNIDECGTWCCPRCHNDLELLDKVGG